MVYMHVFSLYQTAFAACLVVTAGLFYKSKSSESSKGEVDPAFKAFQKQYLLVYMFAMAGDWLQGPYVYALYSDYGYSQSDIATLFVAGFGSSMIFGTFIGAYADKVGRKKMAGIYCAIYIASCCSKHFDNYWMLMIGRLTGGVATSLLYSIFDSWLCSEHAARGFDPELLSDTFSKAMVANSVVAITSGIVAESVTSMMPKTLVMESMGFYMGGYTAPFDLASVCLVVCFMLTLNWNENYGDKNQSTTSGLSMEAISTAFNVIKNNEKVLLIGCVASLFEGSMFSFVFMWTPVMQNVDTVEDSLPFGLIFATFMICAMAGSTLFGLISKSMDVAFIGKIMFGVATVSMAMPWLSSDRHAVFMAFLVFEGCVGIYWPCVGTLKGIHVPDQQRSAIYNLFRVPLNVIVLVLLEVDWDNSNKFFCIVAMLGLATVLLSRFAVLAKQDSTASSSDIEMEKAALVNEMEEGNTDATV